MLTVLSQCLLLAAIGVGAAALVTEALDYPVPLEFRIDPAPFVVATFIGSPKMNVIGCTPSEGAVILADGTRLPIPGYDGEPAHLGVRPEHILITAPEEGILKGVVGVAEHLGGDSFIYVDIPGLEEPVNVRVAGGADIAEDHEIGLSFDLADAHVFGADEERLNVS